MLSMKYRAKPYWMGRSRDVEVPARRLRLVGRAGNVAVEVEVAVATVVVVVGTSVDSGFVVVDTCERTKVRVDVSSEAVDEPFL